MDIISEIENKQIRTDVPAFKVGDTIRVYSKIKEGDKERIQAFEGIVIKQQGGSVRKNFTVRKLVQGVGVEKTYLLHSPKINKVKVIRKGKVRRAKLFYLRDRIGSRATKVQEEEKKTTKE